MKSQQMRAGVWMRMGCLVLALLAPSTQAAPQERGQARERSVPASERDVRSADDHDEILAGLEQGIAALKKLGRREEAMQLERIAGELQRKRKLAQRGQQTDRVERESDRPRERERQTDRRPTDRRQSDRAPAGIEQLERRLEIIKSAQGALARGGVERGARTLEQFLAVGKLQQEGAEPARMAQAFEGLSMGNIIEYLQKATALYREWGRRSQAAGCHELAEYYAKRTRASAQQAKEGSERERAAEGAERELQVAAEQVRVLRYAHTAMRESGRLDTAALLERMVHLRVLQIEKGGRERIEKARGVSPSLIQLVEALRLSTRIYREKGDVERAKACATLAETWGKKLPGAGVERSPVRETRTNVDELSARMERLQAELAELTSALRRLKTEKAGDK